MPSHTFTGVKFGYTWHAISGAHESSVDYIPYPRERAPTTECSPTPLFWLNFLLRYKVYALYIVRNLLHYNNDAAASYLVWNYVNMPVGCG